MREEHLKKQIVGFLNTPPIWNGFQFNVKQFNFPKIDITTFKPEAIPNNIRLGHQMEYVFKQLISQSSKYRILLHNLPIRREKQTLGEIDFILENIETKTPIHIELTYKFYIINPVEAEPIKCLMGPNKRDMFLAKMDKIKRKQFALIHSPEAIKALKEIGITQTSIEQQVCYKAQLYVPYTSNHLNIHPLNTQCICGYWLSLTNFDVSEFKEYQFYIPNKSEWVITPHNQVLWSSHNEIIEVINQELKKEKAPMVWMKKTETEFEKFFVIWW